MNGEQWYAGLSRPEQEQLLERMDTQYWDTVDLLRSLQVGRQALMNAMKNQSTEVNSPDTRRLAVA